jgi:hypothetical protein
LVELFSSKDSHKIVGRASEESIIQTFIQSNIEKDISGLMYCCGHPGQGKTAVVSQVLFDYFGHSNKITGGLDERLFILKYNAMVFTGTKGTK